MELKDYQKRVCEEVELYLRALADEYTAGNRRYGSIEAWRKRNLGRYNQRQNGLSDDLPNVCIKVPTGGGKTLLATQILGAIHRILLKERNGAGLVLWVVPSSQIYRDTLKRLRDRYDLYRLMLEHAISRRIEVWEKHEIARLSPARLRDCLNILVVQLASTNRETKEQLKFFRDSGGNIVDHFPPEDDYGAHRKLKEQVSNLDMIENDAASERYLAATSIGNLVRLCKPVVILDEGHKATSRKARETIEGFNAAFIVELSATPHREANIVSRVSGQELLDEEMIKLPLNIATSGAKNPWDILTRVRDKRAALAAKAAEHQSATSKPIRPIVLVQVERTGKAQRGAGFIHAEQVKEYLIQKLSVDQKAIALKTSEDDGLEDVDLLDEGCPIEWIITKSALQEGWDCPFAYLLVSLSSTGSAKAMTQLVGRVLRQPHQKRTQHDELNESYVYCLHQTSSQITKEVKKALEDEGYEGDASGVVVDSSRPEQERQSRMAHIRPEFASLYSRSFEGKVFLPRFCIKEGKDFRPLDYFEHLISRLDVDAFKYKSIDWRLTPLLSDARDRFYRYSLGNTSLERQYETQVDLLESDEQVIAWLAANLKFEFLSHKQLRRIIRRAVDQQCKRELHLKGSLGLVKFVVREHLARFVQEQIDLQMERVFDELFDAKRILFYLECAQCRVPIPDEIRIERTGPITPLTHANGRDVEKSLFDFVESESQNAYERQIALVLDRHADVLWWYRNKVGEDNFMVQGYKRQKVYPDFVVRQKDTEQHHVLVLEGKGKHLEGNPDTTYKRALAAYFDRAGKRVTWQQLGEPFKDHMFRFQVLDEAQPHGRDWQDELRDLLAESS